LLFNISSFESPGSVRPKIAMEEAITKFYAQPEYLFHTHLDVYNKEVLDDIAAIFELDQFEPLERIVKYHAALPPNKPRKKIWISYLPSEMDFVDYDFSNRKKLNQKAGIIVVDYSKETTITWFSTGDNPDVLWYLNEIRPFYSNLGSFSRAELDKLFLKAKNRDIILSLEKVPERK
jgi:hypothetical protein